MQDNKLAPDKFAPGDKKQNAPFLLDATGAEISNKDSFKKEIEHLVNLRKRATRRVEKEYADKAYNSAISQLLKAPLKLNGKEELVTVLDLEDGYKIVEILSTGRWEDNTYWQVVKAWSVLPEKFSSQFAALMCVAALTQDKIHTDAYKETLELLKASIV